MHDLKEIACFTSVGKFVPVEEGGQKRISVPLPVPYYRWYCSCGAVGGKSYAHREALYSFNQHKVGDRLR